MESTMPVKKNVRRAVPTTANRTTKRKRTTTPNNTSTRTQYAATMRRIREIEQRYSRMLSPLYQRLSKLRNKM
jgi:hypothetical protein